MSSDPHQPPPQYPPAYYPPPMGYYPPPAYVPVPFPDVTQGSETPRPVTTRRSSSVPMLLGAIAFLLLVIAGAGAYFVWEDRKDKQDRAELDNVRMKILSVNVRISDAWAKCFDEALKTSTDLDKNESDCDRKVAPMKDELYKLKAQEDLILSRHPDWR